MTVIAGKEYVVTARGGSFEIFRLRTDDNINLSEVSEGTVNDGDTKFLRLVGEESKIPIELAPSTSGMEYQVRPSQ